MCPTDRPTSVRPLTPAGRGAVAVIEVRGPRATTLVSECFEPARTPSLGNSPLRRIRFGRWRPGGEELVVCRVDAEVVEVHCHGGNATVELIVESLVQRGAIYRKWDAASCDIKPGWQHDAERALAMAATERTSLILLDQWNGALAGEVERICLAIASRNIDAALERCRKLLATAPTGLHLTQPWKVVLAGAPNVGKSSLANAILGYERAVVFDQPGTTRDVVQADCAIDGWPVELNDTAGLRDETEPLESMGIERTRRELAQADLVLQVVDAGALAARTESDASVITPFPTNLNALIVLNKCDLLPPAAQHSLVDSVRLDQACLCSAKTGAGLPQLLARISQRLVPVDLPTGAPMLFTAEQLSFLELLTQALVTGQCDVAFATANQFLKSPAVD